MIRAPYLAARTHVHTYTQGSRSSRGRNGIRFDLNSANRSIDFTAFKHPLAKRQSLGVVPVRLYVCVRGTCAFRRGPSFPVCTTTDAHALLVADAVLIIMLIEISTLAKIDGAALPVSTLEQFTVSSRLFDHDPRCRIVTRH